MLTSQYLMIGALIGLGIAWRFGREGRRFGNTVAALFVQVAAAILLTFSSEQLFVSAVLMAVLIGAMVWMVRSAQSAFVKEIPGRLMGQ